MPDPKVLFVTDFLGDVQGGLQLAIRLATERAATLVLLHVVPLQPNDGEAMLFGGLWESSPEGRLAALLPDELGVPFQCIVEVGDPEAQIKDFIRRERVDLLVMEARARPMLQRLFTRSLTERLLHQTDCPIVTYRAGHITTNKRSRRRRPDRSTLSSDVLAILLNARVDALRSWLRSQRESVSTIAASSSVRDGIASIQRARRYSIGKSLLPRIQYSLELELREHQRALGALGVEVVSGDSWLVKVGLGAKPDDSYEHYLARLLRDGAAVSLPLAPASSESYVSCVIQSGALVAQPGEDPALLLFTFDARCDFLRILAQPGPTPSAETYAFDAEGVMLSNSRFPEQLRRVGLLPPDAQTPRRLRVCDPGGNLLTGEGMTGATWPLTKMAVAATAGQDGYDWKGYRDYRGVEVIGAWRWLSEYGFGVAAEMDRG
jgi:nucleotide-binding universal stress UspA family protein